MHSNRDFSRKELLWVDIESCTMHLFHLPSGTKTAFQFDSRLGAAVPVENSNQYLPALQRGLALFDRISGVLQFVDNPKQLILITVLMMVNVIRKDGFGLEA